MTINCKVWGLALICCWLSSSAMADEEDTAYVTINVGQGYANSACKSAQISYLQFIGGTGSCTEKSTVYRAGFGYQFTRMWALEASYGKFGYAESSGSANFGGTVGPGNYSWQLKAVGLTLQAVGTLHMGDDLALFGKFGVAHVEFDEFLGVQPTVLPPPAGFNGYFFEPVVHSNMNTLALGGGVQFALTPHADLRLMLETFGSRDIYRIYGQTDRVKLVNTSLGFVYKY